MTQSASARVNDAQHRRAMGAALKRHQKPSRAGRGFAMLVHAYWQSEQYAKLSPRAVKLLVDLICQYRGSNNGDLTTAWSIMRGRGWRSKDLLYRAQLELERRGWILRTRKGVRERGVHSATLWAVTFEGVNDCRDSHGKSKLDPGITPNPSALHLWRMPSYDTPAEISKRRVRKQKSSPVAGQGSSGSRGDVVQFPSVAVR